MGAHIVDVGLHGCAGGLAVAAGERVDQVCDEHLAIVEALAAGDGEAARTAMQSHIDNVRAHLLQRLTAI